MLLTIKSLLFTKDGRISSSKWWQGMFLSFVFYLILIIVFELVSLPYSISLPEDSRSRFSSYSTLLIMLIVFIGPVLSITNKRLHDLNKSGWLILITLFPFGTVLMFILSFNVFSLPTFFDTNIFKIIFTITSFYSFYLIFIILFVRGTKGPNMYGKDPLEEVITAVPVSS